jgi:isopenicillin N synthase-like dioxygenase
VKEYVGRLFRLPLGRKLAVKMEESERFLGYNPLGYEVTKGKKDNREQFDFRCDIPRLPYREGRDPPYVRTIGPAQWPEEGEEIQGFKDTTQKARGGVLRALVSRLCMHGVLDFLWLASGLGDDHGLKGGGDAT